MKKIIAFILALSICFAFCSCGGADNDVSEKDDEIAEEKESENKNSDEADADDDTDIDEVTTLKEDASVVNHGLEVVASYVYDSDIYIVVKNITEKPVLSFTVAYLPFDKNGLPTESNYKRGTNGTANIMPGEKQIVSFYGNSTDAYASAIVTNITYSDETTWEFDKVSDWYSTVKKDFTVAAYNESLTKIAAEAVKAETNEYLSIDSTEKIHRNRYSTDDDFDLTLTNKSTKDIVKATIRVLEYDENGYAVSTSPYDTYCKNDRSASGTINISAGDTEKFTNDLFFEASCKKYKCIVQTVEFADGETWTNPYLYEWIIANNKTFS